MIRDGVRGGNDDLLNSQSEPLALWESLQSRNAEIRKRQDRDAEDERVNDPAVNAANTAAVFDVVAERSGAGQGGALCGLSEDVLAVFGGRGQTNNMAPVNSQWTETIPFEGDAAVAACVDWLAWSCEAAASDHGMLLDRLEAARSKAAEHGQQVAVEFGGVQCLMMPHGIGVGSNHRKYVLKAGGSIVSIRDREAEAGKPNVYVETRGETLLNLGVQGALEAVDALFVALGLSMGRSYVSRVDLAADVESLPMWEVISAMAASHHCCRAKEWTAYGKRTKQADAVHDGERFFETSSQTFMLGAKSSPIKLRFYDKLAEMASNPEKRKQWIQRRFGGREPDVVTRVEFQVRREGLVAQNIGSLEDLLRGVRGLAGYLTFGWFRAFEKPVDKTHTTRGKVAEWWKRVRGQFEHVAGSVVQAVPKKVVRRGTTESAMLKQAVGCLKRAFAELGQVPKTAEEITAGVVHLVEANLDAVRKGIVEKLDMVHELRSEQLAEWFETESRNIQVVAPG
ncbi:MAG: replication initiation factor domain-containing protein [Planctomycetota bacterium]